MTVDPDATRRTIRVRRGGVDAGHATLKPELATEVPMAQPHALPGQVMSVRPLGAAIAGARTTALLKAQQLEVIRVVLHAGRSMPEHATPGEITVQCLEGSVEFTLPDAMHVLEPGDWLHLAPHAPHALRALSDASLLVTICLLPGSAA